MLWVKSLHIVFMVAWFAGLFYLPRLFVYHASAEDAPSLERFKRMERRLYWGIMTPAGVLTVAFGLCLWLVWFRGPDGSTAGWLRAKMALVALLIAYHAWCGKLMHDFAAAGNTKSPTWLRWFNEAPTVLLLAIVLLAVLKPF